MFCAAHAASAGLSVAVAEHGKYLGRKLGITGKGRCNVTNDCSADDVLKNIPRNPRFLYSALSRYSPADVMEYFENLGVPLKTERGRRVFPVSDRAGDIVAALEKQLKMMETILYLYDKCAALVAKQVPVSRLLATGLFDELVQMKYTVPNDDLSKLDELQKAIDTKLAAVAQG